MENDQEVGRTAAGLTRAQLACLSHFTPEWQAGPDMPNAAFTTVVSLREAGLVERHFGDMGEPQHSATADSLKTRLSACWWFRLTPLGTHLLANTGDA